ncbi:hypothetical protein DN752_22425 [Echinicola strongylocentroti]|uniref:Uncharacterized protein n=1 Tax=Echinicola strongylocentroti TaxID=1795355 RepID=A0A2Z4IPF0_9BACT|nr:hypothetical protein DN752_22425 [Echinicola strongylocentroti]
MFSRKRWSSWLHLFLWGITNPPVAIVTDCKSATAEPSNLPTFQPSNLPIFQFYNFTILQFSHNQISQPT